MKKDEAQRIIRALTHDWVRSTGFNKASGEMPSFSDFKTYVEQRTPDALRFRSTRGPIEDAETWFDQELGQTWRN